MEFLNKKNEKQLSEMTNQEIYYNENSLGH